MKIIRIVSLSFLLFGVVSCFEDKGNYNYSELPEIAIENKDGQETFSILRGIEPLVINQKVTSSEFGEIKDNDPNLELTYSINTVDSTGALWSTMQTGKINFNKIPNYTTGGYKVRFMVKDKRTEISTYKIYNVNIASSTYEGWILLGTEGAEQRTRMDMISVIGKDRREPAYDLMVNGGLPEDTKGAHCIGFYPNNSNATMDRMYIFSDDGGYMLEREELTTTPVSTINYVDFILPTKLTEPVEVYTSLGGTAKPNVLVTAGGDAYVQENTAKSNKFQDPINTFTAGSMPQFKVAPYVGYNATRQPAQRSTVALFFDVTNKRFVAYKTGQAMYKLTNPAEEIRKFDYDINMDLVCMHGTAYDKVAAFALLKDNQNKFHIACFKIVVNVDQYAYAENINCPEIMNAKFFAFHSQYPIMYYAVGNKVYSYNWLRTDAGNVATPVITLAATEEVTMIKFCLYSNTKELNSSGDPDFMTQQYNLLVASHNGSENGGKLGFYKTSDIDYSMSKVDEKSGFCKIKDVVYRERRK